MWGDCGEESGFVLRHLEVRVIIIGPSGRNAELKSSEYEELGWRISSDEMVLEAQGEHELREREEQSGGLRWERRGVGGRRTERGLQPFLNGESFH